MRLFIAAELPQNVLESLAETSAALRERVPGRCVPFANFHVTLAFLGEVDGAAVPRVADAMREALADARPVDVKLGGFGMFGRRAKATLWQAVEDDGSLAAMARSLREELAVLGIELEDRRFVGHVTLMRSALLEGVALGVPCGGSGTVERVTLFKSELSRDGATYTPLVSVDL